MPIRLRETRRTFADRVPGLWGESPDDVPPGSWMPLPRRATRTLGTLRLPIAAGNRADVALYSSLAPHAQGAPAAVLQDRKAAASCQRAQLVAWEDEGGATACVK